MSIKAAFTKVLNTIKSVLPQVENYLPTVSVIVKMTPWPYDDIALGAFQSIYEFAKKLMGDEQVKEGAAIGVQAIASAMEAGMTFDEAKEALLDGVKLQIRANEIRKAAREAIKKDGKVVIGDLTVSQVDELKSVPKSVWRTLAQTEYLSTKLN